MVYPIYHNHDWLDPDQVKVSIQDVGFLRGYGIFDFFRIMHGSPVFLSDHLDRFLASAQKMGIPHSYTKEQLAGLIHEIASRSEVECLGVKMILSGGDSMNGFEPLGKSQLFIIPNEFQFMDPHRGVALASRDFVREMADIKTLNYSFAVRNWPIIKSQGFDDFIYFSRETGVSESSRSNLFCVKSGVLYTPAQHILEGITRKHVIDLAANIMEVRVQDVSLEEFMLADEVFTTGSTKRVVPVNRIDDTWIGSGKKGIYTRQLYDLLVQHEN
ncbi:aminotransferase class IV [Aquirufa rosea]|uniref:branched-chain-amino-acid transaminase n=1 Tax=Aquirufa rosea TaxID=2509241 RepID=A0A4Q1BXI2_9BACT|nr:aminotransferase class IV [Aquirufa rosea]RXK47110.1 branched-chain amino acid aminotransferase [Aquirufa rosea]